jgi:hypothetical protein
MEMFEAENWNELLTREESDLGELEIQLRKIMEDDVYHQPTEQPSLNFVAPSCEENHLQMADSDFQSYCSFEDIESNCGSDSANSTPPPMVKQRGRPRSCLRRTIVEKKRRHLDLEVERRQKMNEKYQELYTLCKPSRRDKASILESANHQLQEHNFQMHLILSSLTV